MDEIVSTDAVPREPHGPRWRITAGLVVILAAGLLAIMLWVRSRPRAAQVPAQPRVGEGKQITNDGVWKARPGARPIVTRKE